MNDNHIIFKKIYESNLKKELCQSFKTLAKLVINNLQKMESIKKTF